MTLPEYPFRLFEWSLFGIYFPHMNIVSGGALDVAHDEHTSILLKIGMPDKIYPK